MAEPLFCWSCGFRNRAGSGFCGACGVHQTRPAIGAVESAPLLYATFGSRLAAGIIDWVVIWVILIAIGIFVSSAEAASESDIPGYQLLLLLPFTYHFAATAIWGRTIGKSALSLHVVSESGTKPRVEQAFVRETIGKFVSTVVLYIGFIWAAFDQQGRAWHDLMAGTRVVYASR